jgi:hypothetical protein
MMIASDRQLTPQKVVGNFILWLCIRIRNVWGHD